MKTCKFCSNKNDVSKVKIKGIKSFYACSNCLRIINNALNLKGDEYSREIERLEKDLTISRDVLNLLYIIPYYSKSKKQKIKIKKSHYLKYLADYQRSNLISSVLYECLIAFFLSFGITLFEPLKIPMTMISIVIYFSSVLLITFLSGILILNTGVTKIPCKKTWAFTSKINNWFANNFELIYKIKVKNKYVDYLITLPLLRLPLYIINMIFLVVVFILSLVLVSVVAIIHALFLFAPAYYIDYKRRTSK